MTERRPEPGSDERLHPSALKAERERLARERAAAHEEDERTARQPADDDPATMP